MTDPLSRLRRQAHELAKASDRRDAAHAERDRLIRAARVGGIGVTAIAQAAHLSRAGVRKILEARPYDGPPGDEQSLHAAVVEAEHREHTYARQRWRRDQTLLDALDAGASRQDVAVAARLTAGQLAPIIQAGRTTKPRESYRRGRAGHTDWDAIKQQKRDTDARRRAQVRAGQREVTLHGRRGYDAGCRCDTCVQGRRAYDQGRGPAWAQRWAPG